MDLAQLRRHQFITTATLFCQDLERGSDCGHSEREAVESASVDDPTSFVEIHNVSLDDDG
jgi:hypothetical protein